MCWDSGTTEKSAKTWEVKLPASTLMRSPVCHPMMCIPSVYASQIGRTQEEKDAFRSNMEEIIRHVEPETVLVVAGDTNAHVGKRQNSDENIGKYGWGRRNREGQDLVDMLARNQLVVVNFFYQKRESPR